MKWCFGLSCILRCTLIKSSLGDSTNTFLSFIISLGSEQNPSTCPNNQVGLFGFDQQFSNTVKASTGVEEGIRRKNDEFESCCTCCMTRLCCFLFLHINMIWNDHYFRLKRTYVNGSVTIKKYSMFGFFSSAPKAPRLVPGDLVVPVGFFDDTIIFRTFVLYTLFVFDDALEPQRLRTSLEHVVSRPG